MQASPEQQSLVLELQLLDNEIMQANTKLKSLPEVEQLLHIDKRIITATDEVATVKLEADQITLELRRGEVDVETVTDRIKKDEVRLASGNATPKELEQTQHEIQTLKKRQLALEEIELEIMVRSEAVTERSKVLTTDLASLETLKAEINQRLTAASGEINTVITNKRSDREKVVVKIEKPLIDLYEKIRTASGGVAAAALVGHVRGGLAMASVLSAGAFGAVCGSSVATSATITQVAYPEMRRHGYKGRLSTASLAAGGTLGILIPPSVPLVVYAILTEQNIAKLFAAALIPGILAMTGYLLVIFLYARARPDMAPLSPSLPWPEKWSALIAIWPIVGVFLIVFGGIYGGVFSPTEGAGVGAVLTMLLGFVKKELKLSGMQAALLSTAETTAIFFSTAPRPSPKVLSSSARLNTTKGAAK